MHHQICEEACSIRWGVVLACDQARSGTYGRPTPEILAPTWTSFPTGTHRRSATIASMSAWSQRSRGVTAPADHAAPTAADRSETSPTDHPPATDGGDASPHVDLPPVDDRDHRPDPSSRARHRSRTPRLLGAAVIAVAIIVGLGEWPLRGIVERQIATGVRSEFELTDRPEVLISGKPFIASVVRQELQQIAVTVRGEVFEGLQVETLRVTLAPVDFALADLVRGKGTAQVGGGTGVAIITDGAINDYLRNVAGLPLRVRFTDGAAVVDATLTIAGMTAAASATGLVSIDGTLLRFTPTAVNPGPFGAVPGGEELVLQQLGFTTPLPELTAITLRSVRLTSGSAEVLATFDKFEVEL